MPEIRFLADDSVEAGEQVEAALELARLRAAGLAEPPPIVPSSRLGGASSVGQEEWKPRSSFPDVGAAFADGSLDSGEGNSEESDEDDDESEDDDDGGGDDDGDGFLDLGPSSKFPSSASAARSSSSSSSSSSSGELSSRTRASAASAAASASSSSSSQQQQQQLQDSFFGFEPPPLEGFWPGGDVPGVFGIRRITARNEDGEKDDGTEGPEEGDLGDGVLGPDGIVTLAPGRGGRSESRGGGGKPPRGGGVKPRQRTQRRR